jgi:uncharacterized oligopeptide transporter (OPT) family protein
MINLSKLNRKWLCVIFIVMDTICVGMGMGVPIFPIILGFFVGWYLADHVTYNQQETQALSRKILYYALLTSGVTLIEMILLWGPSIRWLFNEYSDFTNYGHPMILYDPKFSFIGWLFLMIVISPFLQLLMTIFGFHVKKSRTDKNTDSTGAEFDH